MVVPFTSVGVHHLTRLVFLRIATVLVAAVMLSAGLLALAPAAHADVQLIAKWGTSGSGDGQFDYAPGVASASDGSVFVVDYNLNRVQRFTAGGVYMGQWGSFGIAPGEFDSPHDVAVAADGTVYVTDYHDYRVQRFTAPSAFLGEFGSFGFLPGQFNGPLNVAVAPDGTVYVTDNGNERVQYFSAAGGYLGQWGSFGAGPGQFNAPSGVAVASDGTVYVTDASNDRVQYFTATGGYLGEWGGSGSGDGQLANPLGVSVAPDGTVYVADTNNQRIQHFTATGAYLGQWGSAGSGDGEFDGLTDIDAAANGAVYAADTANDRIQAFADLGASLTGSAAFGSVAVGSTSIAQTLTLTNTATSPLPITSVAAAGADASEFQLQGTTCPVGGTLNAAASCTIRVAAAPSALGAISAQVDVQADWGLWSQTYTTALSATGTVPQPAPATAPRPVITSLSSLQGPSSGGKQITLRGENFTGASVVRFGGVPAEATVDRFDRITATVPAHTPGTVRVTVRTAAGLSEPTEPAVYTYLDDDQSQPATSPRPPRAATFCTVPRLHGLTLAAAARSLQTSGCALGHTRRLRSHGRSKPWLVVRQSRRAGLRYPAGAHVSVTVRRASS